MLRLFSAALILIVAAPGLSARDIHVSPAGKDTNSGGATSPVREIRRALALLKPGDTVHIADGQYKGFNAVRLGAKGKPTTLRATGQKAVILPTKDRGVNNPHNIVVWLCHDMVFDGLRTSGGPLSGMRIVDSDNITVRNGVFGNNGKWGIVTSHCNDLLLENNECHGSRIEHGIYVANSGDRPILRGNRIYGNANSGLRANGDVSQGGDGIISGALFENNLIWDNCANGGAAMNFDGLQDGIIRNNLIYNNHASGIALFKGGGAAGPKGMQVLNNTIIVPATGRYCLRITDAIGTLTVRNNILCNLNTVKGPFSWNTQQDAELTDSDYNLFCGGRFVSTDREVTKISMEDWMASGHESHSVPDAQLDTLFTDPAKADYRLAPASPALDHGTPTPSVETDLVGTKRPQGAALDIGAYESTPL